MNPNIPKCNTLVFFDLETSGLPSFQITRITELSFWAVERSQFLSSTPKEVPRVTNRLSLCVYPARLIDPKASEISGLDNYNLEHQSHFNDDTANTVLSFLNRLKKPICLIAHNGDKFDFPLLKSEIERLGKVCNIKYLVFFSTLTFLCCTQELPSHVLCCDSLSVFKELDSGEAVLEICETRIETDKAPVTYSKAELLSNSVASENRNLNGTPGEKTVNPFQYVNERTPIKRPLEAEKTNSSQGKRTKPSSPDKSCYKLGAIYHRIFDEQPETSHHAEADVKMLMLAAGSFSSRFLDKLDARAKPFANVRKLW